MLNAELFKTSRKIMQLELSYEHTVYSMQYNEVTHRVGNAAWPQAVIVEKKML